MSNLELTSTKQVKAKQVKVELKENKNITLMGKGKRSIKSNGKPHTTSSSNWEHKQSIRAKQHQKKASKARFGVV